MAGGADRLRKKELSVANMQKDLDLMGFNAVEEAVNLYKMNIEAYKSGRGWTDKGDSGAAYLSNAGSLIMKILDKTRPTLQAMAIKDMTEKNETRVMSTSEAVKIIQNDPMSPDYIKAKEVILAMDSKVNVPGLPIGLKDDK